MKTALKKVDFLILYLLISAGACGLIRKLVLQIVDLIGSFEMTESASM